MANITANLYWIYFLRVIKVKACTLGLCFQGTIRIFPKEATKEFPAAQYMAELSLECMDS